MPYTSKQIAATINHITDQVLSYGDNRTKNWFKAHLIYHINMQLSKNLDKIELGVGKKGFESFIELLAVKGIVFPTNQKFILKKNGESIAVSDQETFIIYSPEINFSKSYFNDDLSIQTSSSGRKRKF